MSFEIKVEEIFNQYFPNNIKIKNIIKIGGGCINDAQKVETNAGNFFLKTNDACRFPGMFEAEAKGLEILKKANVIKIPEVFFCGELKSASFIILEYIDSGARNKNFWENFGRALAALHRKTAPAFGLDHDNYIGSLRQHNNRHGSWLTFFVQERLQKQINIARENRLLANEHIYDFEKLLGVLADFFPEEPPALLHGDLWSGNFMAAENGEACLIDPAVYYGHREAEIAFTQLFGGFDRKFYSAYHESFPLQQGFERRKEVYNLYPLLVHLNLFGASYLRSIEQILKRFS